MAKKWLFFYNFQFLGILPKIAASAYFGYRKIGKKTNIKKLLPTNCRQYPKVHFCPFLRQLEHFPWSWYIFRQTFFFKIFADFCWVSKKMTVFRPKIGQFSTKICEILEINKKHLNTSNSQILGHLKHFWPKYCHFRPFLGHFWPY